MHYAIGHRTDNRVVGDDGRRRAEFAIDLIDCLEHQNAGLAVEGARRLVTKQDLRLLGDRTGNRDPLLLAPDSCAGK